MRKVNARFFVRAITGLSGALLLAFGAGPLLAEAGFEPREISRLSRLQEAEGVVIISIRSEQYLPADLDVFFLREGGSIANNRDVARFSRGQRMMDVNNDNTNFRPKSFRLVPGRYTLVAHGLNCPAVPSPGEVCTVRIGTNGVGMPRPTRAYEGEVPSFEVVAGQVTNAGDFALTRQNYIRWSSIPESDLAEIIPIFASLPSGPIAEVPEQFMLTHTLRRESLAEVFERARMR